MFDAILPRVHNIPNIYLRRNDFDFPPSRPKTLKHVDAEYDGGRYWLESLIQSNPNYKKASTIAELVSERMVHQACGHLLRNGKSDSWQPHTP